MSADASGILSRKTDKTDGVVRKTYSFRKTLYDYLTIKSLTGFRTPSLYLEKLIYEKYCPDDTVPNSTKVQEDDTPVRRTYSISESLYNLLEKKAKSNFRTINHELESIVHSDFQSNRQRENDKPIDFRRKLSLTERWSALTIVCKEFKDESDGFHFGLRINNNVNEENSFIDISLNKHIGKVDIECDETNRWKYFYNVEVNSISLIRALEYWSTCQFDKALKSAISRGKDFNQMQWEINQFEKTRTLDLARQTCSTFIMNILDESGYRIPHSIFSGKGFKKYLDKNVKKEDKSENKQLDIA